MQRSTGIAAGGRCAAHGRRGSRGSVLIVVVGVLAVLALIGICFVLTARTGTATAQNYADTTQTQMLAEGEIARVKSILLQDLVDPATGAPLLNKSHTYPNAQDPWLFGWRGDGVACLQTSFGGTAMPTVDNDGDGRPDSVWRTVRLSNGDIAKIATLVVDHESKANLNVWGNTQKPATGTHLASEGLHPSELNLMKVLNLDETQAADRTTYGLLFTGTGGLPGYFGPQFGRYGLGVGMGPGATGVDDDGDTDDGVVGHDDDPDGLIDEHAETCDEPDECCVTNPGGTGNDKDTFFGLEDQWELLHPTSFCSRFEALMWGRNLDAPFSPAAGSQLGSYRQNLTTLGGDPQWVGVGAVNAPTPADRLRLRLDLNHATLAELETAFLQAGFTQAQTRQMAVNLQDYRDADNDVTAHPQDANVCGHERQPFLAEIYVAYMGNGANARRAVVVELWNPYDSALDVRNWQIQTQVEPGTWTNTPLVNPGNPTSPVTVPAMGCLLVVAVDQNFTFDPPLDSLVPTLALANGPDGADSLRWPKENSNYRLRLVRALRMNDAPGGTSGTLVVDDTVNELNNQWKPGDLPSAGGGGGGGGGGNTLEQWDFYRSDCVVNRYTLERTSQTLGGSNLDSGDVTTIVNTLQDLITFIRSLGLPQGIENALVQKAQNAIDKIQRGQIEPALNQINALIQQVQALSGGQIPSGSATTIINMAANAVSIIRVRVAGYFVPIPNGETHSFASLGELGQVLNWNQNGAEPYTDDYAVTAVSVNEKEKDIKFDLSGDWYAGGPDNPNRRVLDLLCIRRPDHDGLDNDGLNGVDDPGEAALPVCGKININAASHLMLERAFTCGPFSAAQAAFLAEFIVTRRESTAGPFTHLGDLFRSGPGADVSLAMGLWGRNGQDDNANNIQDEKIERDRCFAFLANLVTTRSNVFTVYVTVETWNADQTERRSRRRAIAILDRTQAAMTVRTDAAARVPYVLEPVREIAFRWMTD
jgi:hypothetical protein